MCSFLPVHLTELPQAEWVQIITSRLRQAATPAQAETWGSRMVDFHCQITAMLGKSDPVFPELGPLTTTSIRELLKWTLRMQWHFRYVLLLLTACKTFPQSHAVSQRYDSNHSTQERHQLAELFAPFLSSIC